MRKAISPVIAAVILTSIMLTIVSVALYYSTSLIDMNRQTMEYEYAKEQLTYAATALEQVAFGTGGSRYVRFSLTSTGISFEKASSPLSVWVWGVQGGGIQQVFSGYPLRLKVCGGPLVTTSPRLLYPESGDLQGELKKLIVESGEPIVVVYENFSQRACAYMYTRVRVFYNGQINVTVGGSVKRYNFFTIHVVVLKPGYLGGSGTIPVVFRNVGLNVTEYKFDGSSDLAVLAEQGTLQQQVKLPRAPEGAPADGLVVVVKVATVEVSTR
ncbi:hypothetical protein [Thermofilum pendens]|nr:hypothetical protein [Thermofilum pendens]